MPSSTYKSPFASAFNSAVKRGSSYNNAVCNIASRSNKTTDFVWNSLFKAGLCGRQKFNGKWIYFPFEGKKCNATTCKATQYNMWQCFVEWCVCNGCCTPEQLWNHCGSQKEFMTWCRKFFGKQFTTGTTTKKKTTTKSGRNSGYSFSASKKRSTSTRRYRRAA